jgi:hypothetical protein
MERLEMKLLKRMPIWSAFILAMGCVPAFAQVDLSGVWANPGHMDWLDHGRGPDLVDYSGIPINDAARVKALSYTAALQAEQERQCEYYTPAYVVFGPFGLNIWNEVDPATAKVVAWKMGAWIDKDITTIWMDGRLHPSKYAFHPFSGFTTGVWEGDTLTAYSTHVKVAYLRRNGVPSSDQVTVVEHIVRHGDILAIMGIIQDPVYLSEPFVMSSIWQEDPHASIPRTSQPCEPIMEDQRLEDGTVPHFPPGKNPYINEVTERYHVPLEAVLGGAKTMYPEFRKKIKDKYVPVEKCTRYCCGPPSDPALKCIRDATGKER